MTAGSSRSRSSDILDSPRSSYASGIACALEHLTGRSRRGLGTAVAFGGRRGSYFPPAPPTTRRNLNPRTRLGGPLPRRLRMLVKPEEVGLSSPRLARIGEHFQRYIDAGKLAGTLTLVARRGQIAYLEPQGHLEIE